VTVERFRSGVTVRWGGVAPQPRFWGDAVLADAAKEQTLGPSAPVGLEIPAIGLRADVVPIGSRPEWALDEPAGVPVRGADAPVGGAGAPVGGADAPAWAPAGGTDAPVGWDRRSPVPGELGSSVMVGQVEAAFAGLRLLRPGDEILVRRADGVLVRFVVTGIGLYPRKAFPNERVYGPRDHPELTLVTRGGTIDRNRRSYGSNLIVYARSVPD